jgi:S-adenosylmethionine/arginine decarboxylase-like enzyme
MSDPERGPLLVHLIAQCFDVPDEVTNSAKVIERVLRGLVDSLGLRLVDMRLEKFEIGVTGLALVTESHVAIHTWPEYRFLHIDLLSCAPIDAVSFQNHVETMIGGRAVVEDVGHYAARYQQVINEGDLQPPPHVEQFRQSLGQP